MAYALQARLSPTTCERFWRCLLARRYQLSIESVRCFAKHEEIDDEFIQKPVKFTTSKANFETAKDARTKNSDDNTPISQTISLGLSLAVFLIYFGYVREPNDLDETIYQDISDRVPGYKEANDKLKANSLKMPGAFKV